MLSNRRAAHRRHTFLKSVLQSGKKSIIANDHNANRLLASIPEQEYQRLHALLEPVELKFGAVLYYPGKAIALMAQISQTAACNRFHDAQARLARWLLMTRDRVGSDQFPLTHEFLAHMLGLRREGVTEAAAALKQRKVISYSRGRIQILDVPALKKSACSCYQTVKKVFDRAQG